MLYAAIIIGILLGVVSAGWLWAGSRGVGTSELVAQIPALTDVFRNPTVFGFLRDAFIIVLLYVAIDFGLSCLRRGVTRARDLRNTDDEEIAWWEKQQ